MLYNTRWERISLQRLIAWLQTMPADGEYRYMDNRGCLLAQFFTSVGYSHVRVGMANFTHTVPVHSELGWAEAEREGRVVRFPLALASIAHGQPRTFGAALKRAQQSGPQWTTVIGPASVPTPIY